MKATVLVRPKQGILDPQGDAVRNALGHLGFEVGEARVGRVIELEFEPRVIELEFEPKGGDPKREVEEMCSQLLANPLIESFEVEVA
jgi:phosphoribosylformylglycinamidine synthase PurS subunit